MYMLHHRIYLSLLAKKFPPVFYVSVLLKLEYCFIYMYINEGKCLCSETCIC